MAGTVTNAALNLVRDNLLNNPGAQSMQITWLAIGTGVQGTPATATQLATEVFRKQVTSYANGAAAGEGIINALLAPTDSSGTAISEWGLFAGNASGLANSGVLVYYSTYSHTHTSTESIQFQADGTV